MYIIIAQPVVRDSQKGGGGVKVTVSLVLPTYCWQEGGVGVHCEIKVSLQVYTVTYYILHDVSHVSLSVH